MTLKELRRQALFIKISHYRYVGTKENPLLMSAADIRTNGLSHFIHAKGGATKMQIVYPDGFIQNVQSRCMQTDAFCKKSGIQYCLDRLE